MVFLHRGIGLAGVLALLFVVPASGQDKLYANKTPAQVFASDCSICHKTPQSVGKAGGPFGLGLESFLRSHYTASDQTAAAMAKYLQAVEPAPAAPERGSKRAGSGTKSGAAKKADKKGDSKAGAKPDDAKPAVSLPGDNKPAASDAKPEEAKPEEAKPAEAKPAEPKAE